MDTLTLEQIKEYGDLVGKYFDNHRERRYVYEKYIGTGKDGVIYLIKRLTARHRDARSASPSLPLRSAPSPNISDSGITDEDLLALYSDIEPSSSSGSAAATVVASDPEPPSSSSGSAAATVFGSDPVRPPSEERSEERRGREKKSLAEDFRPQRIVLKLDKPPVGEYFGIGDDISSNQSEAEVNNCAKEKRFLQIFLHCQHIVKLIDIPDDPLTKQPHLFPGHGLSESNWLFEEYLENGPLSKFLERLIKAGADAVADKGGRNGEGDVIRLPNRILWSLFLCLIKMVIAMAWPQQESRDMSERPLMEYPIFNFDHTDIHEGNVMFGSDIQAACHSVTPILKLIDLAGAIDRNEDQDAMDEDEFDNDGDFKFGKIGDPGTMLKGVTNNLFFIAKTMAGIIRPELYANETWAMQAIPERDAIRVQTPFKTLPIESVAHELTPTACLGVDDQLRLLVIACMAKKGSDRPNIVERVSRTRDAAYYQKVNNVWNQRRRDAGLGPLDLYDVEAESDTEIQRVVQEFIYSVPLDRRR